MVVGVCRLTLVASHCQSLKDKRNVIRRIKARVRNQFHLPLAEVGSLDKWQRVELGFAVVSNQRGHVERVMDQVVSLIVDMGEAQLVDEERDVLRYGGDMEDR